MASVRTEVSRNISREEERRENKREGAWQGTQKEEKSGRFMIIALQSLFS